MITLQINDEELGCLKDILNKYSLELSRELARTEKKEWVRELGVEEELLKKLIKQLPG